MSGAEEIEKAKQLLLDNGFNVEKIPGQQSIQIVRKRGVDDSSWRYTVNKYAKRYTPVDGEIIECHSIPVTAIKWERQ